MTGSRTLLQLLKTAIVHNSVMWRGIVALAAATRSLSFSQRLFQSLLFQKVQLEANRLKCEAKSLSPEASVLDGPFAGMRYPEFSSAGSMLMPKLLGTYESEISHLFTRRYTEQFPSIIDIGCAEGYYAVGCAVLNSRAMVYAYDTSPAARKLCLGLASANGVANRVVLDTACIPSHFSQWDNKRVLIISDCEGCESTLFSDATVALLKHADLIIEVHEFAGASLCDLTQRLEATHEICVFYSKPDLDKAIEGSDDGVPLHERVLWTAECRPTTMPWLWARSRAATA
jgi:hypothetical protein